MASNSSKIKKEKNYSQKLTCFQDKLWKFIKEYNKKKLIFY